MAKVKGASLRKDQIIKATVDCIVAHGYHNFSMQDVAMAAGVSKGIIHYYFLNKNELMMAVLDKCAMDIEHMLVDKMSTISDPMKKIEAFISVCFDILRSRKEYYQVSMDFWTQINQKEEVRSVISHHYKKFRSTAAEVIKEGISRRVFRDVDPCMYASYIISVVDGFSLQVLFDATQFDYDVVTKTATEIIVAGLRKEGEQ